VKLYYLLLCRTVETSTPLPKSLPLVGKSFALLPIWDLVSTLHSQQTLAFPKRIVIYQTKGHLFKFLLYTCFPARLYTVVPLSTLTLFSTMHGNYDGLFLLDLLDGKRLEA
jgi:hypothetical protein